LVEHGERNASVNSLRLEYTKDKKNEKQVIVYIKNNIQSFRLNFLTVN